MGIKRNKSVIISTLIATTVFFSAVGFTAFAAGDAKPEIPNLGKQVNVNIISQQLRENTKAEGLFDGTQVNEWSTNKVAYWGSGASNTNYIELEITEECNIWRSGTSGWKDHNAPFQILKWNGSSYDDVTELYPQNLTEIIENEWEKTIENLPAGRYKFEETGLRIDSEWYIESTSETGETTNKIVLDVESEKEKIRVNEEVYTDLTIDNITEIAAEDVRIKYDNEKLKFLGFEEVDGIKLVKDIQATENGELRVILASKGEANIVNAKKALLRLKFKGIKPGEALVDITNGRVSDGIEMEKDLTDEQCDEGTIIIEAITDVNNSGEFTLLDLGIDARHLSKDPKSEELSGYNTDIVINDAIDEDDLLEIGKMMVENPNYDPNKY